MASTARASAPHAGRSARAVLYLRQSVAREESISLELQETAGREYCDRMGYTVVAVEDDPGISGRTFKRPGVIRALELIESGQADVMVLWKWSRLSRARLDWAVAVDRVEQAGGRIESATEPLDTTTATGRFARGMLAEFAAFESERIGDVWRETHEHRIAAGLPHAGLPKFGYTYSGGRYHLDPITGPVLAELYRRYADGEGPFSLIRWLNDLGHLHPRSNRPWAVQTLTRYLDSGFGAGHVIRHGELRPGAHQSVITGDEWLAYQVARDARRAKPRAEGSRHLLSGLIRCWCGAAMAGGNSRSGERRRRIYKCGAAHRGRAHTGGTITADVVEAFVVEWVKSLATQINAAPRPTRPQPVEDLGASARAQLARAARRLDTLTTEFIDGVIPKASYERLRDDLQHTIAALEVEVRTADVRTAARPVAMIPNLLEEWDELPVERRRATLRMLIDKVEVNRFRTEPRIVVHSPFQPN